ncbi:MAG: ankyrin repeat domain-containing protein [Pseudomonadota bacterium]
MLRARVALLILCGSAVLTSGQAQAYTEAEKTELLHLAVIIGDENVVASMLDDGFDIHATTASGATPLHSAVAQTHIVELLLLRGADARRQDRAGNTPLHLAAQGGHIGSLLLLMPNTPLDIENNEGFTALDLADKADKTEAVEWLVKKKAPHGSGYDRALPPAEPVDSSFELQPCLGGLGCGPQPQGIAGVEPLRIGAPLPAADIRKLQGVWTGKGFWGPVSYDAHLVVDEDGSASGKLDASTGFPVGELQLLGDVLVVSAVLGSTEQVAFCLAEPQGADHHLEVKVARWFGDSCGDYKDRLVLDRDPATAAGAAQPAAPARTEASPDEDGPDRTDEGSTTEVEDEVGGESGADAEVESSSTTDSDTDDGLELGLPEALELGPARFSLQAMAGVDSNPYRINAGGLRNDGSSDLYLKPHAVAQLVPGVAMQVLDSEWQFQLQAQLDYRALFGPDDAAGVSREATLNPLLLDSFVDGELIYGEDIWWLLLRDRAEVGLEPGRFVSLQGAPIPMGAGLYGETIARQSNLLQAAFLIFLDEMGAEAGGSLWLGRYTQHNVVDSSAELGQLVDTAAPDALTRAGLPEGSLGGLVADAYIKVLPGLMNLFAAAGLGYASFSAPRHRSVLAHVGVGFQPRTDKPGNEDVLFVGWQVPNLEDFPDVPGTPMLQLRMRLLELEWMTLHGSLERAYAPNILYQELVRNHLALGVVLRPADALRVDLDLGAGAWQISHQRYPGQALSVARDDAMALDPYLFTTLGVEFALHPLLRPRLEASLEWYQAAGVSNGPSYQAAAGVPLSMLRGVLNLGMNF